MKITWFRHHHENRNDLLRFGFMRLHYAKELHYIEKPFAEMKAAGFSQAILDYPDPRHLSFILVEKGKTKIRCLVDNEDSFVLITPLITEVDVCFCAGYNTDFFEKRAFVDVYNWQKEADIHSYRLIVEKKIETLGHHFKKIKKFIPIAPNQGSPVAIGQWKQKYRNVEDKLARVLKQGSNFSDVYQGFQLRESYLNSLRNCSLEYDVVVNDSLWGWPNHRINLHKKFAELHGRQYKIHSILNYVPPVNGAAVTYKGIFPSQFPMITAPIKEPYELMVAKSKLAVYACGFHWGWRNIMMLALRTGIPVVTDRLITEPYFNMGEFELTQVDDDSWNVVEVELNKIDSLSWSAAKLINQSVYDKYMSPEVVARYFLYTANSAA